MNDSLRNNDVVRFPIVSHTNYQTHRSLQTLEPSKRASTRLDQFDRQEEVEDPYKVDLGNISRR